VVIGSVSAHRSTSTPAHAAPTSVPTDPAVSASPQPRDAESPAPAASARGALPADDVPVGGGYAHSERFCAQAPVQGEIYYVVSAGTASLHLDLAGLPANAQLGIDWINNSVRGYNVAIFDSDGQGRAASGTERIFRPLARSVAAVFS